MSADWSEPFLRAQEALAEAERELTLAHWAAGVLALGAAITALENTLAAIEL